MNTIEVAKKMVELCQQGNNMEALDTLFSPDIVSVEAGAMPGMEREARGLAAVKAKGEWWMANHEVHSASVTGPGRTMIALLLVSNTKSPTNNPAKG